MVNWSNYSCTNDGYSFPRLFIYDLLKNKNYQEVFVFINEIDNLIKFND